MVKFDPEQQSGSQLERWLKEVKDDPLAFVQGAFPWGKEGTELSNHEGPDIWQTALLSDIRDGFKSVQQVIQLSTVSGHGAGKSALVSWLIIWAMSTMEDTRGIVTANTEVQLRTKTWPELAKWNRMSRTRDMFTYTATALFSSDEDHEKTWRIDAITWSETRTEAFAGLHNQGKRILCIFDEASAIPEIIWETTEGALTDKDTQIIWAVFGNPTRNMGRFKECFGRFRHRWKQHQVDSRTSRFTNKQQIADWIKDYGEDSDFVRVRVRGVFPRAGTMQFITTDVAEQAASQERQQSLEVTILDALVVGVDVARFGEDATVIAFRRGRDAVSIPWVTMRGADTVQIAARLNAIIRDIRPDGVFIDDGGVGAGVIDQLRHLGHNVYAVTFGSSPDNFEPSADGRIAYANKRAEIWGSMKAWLKYGAIPSTPELSVDLTGLEYGYTMKEGRDAIILEKKEDMKKRGLASPDYGDALACTFAMYVAPSDHRAQLSGKPTHKIDYDPMAEAYRAR